MLDFGPHHSYPEVTTRLRLSLILRPSLGPVFGYLQLQKCFCKIASNPKLVWEGNKAIFNLHSRAPKSLQHEKRYYTLLWAMCNLACLIPSSYRPHLLLTTIWLPVNIYSTPTLGCTWKGRDLGFSLCLQCIHKKPVHADLSGFPGGGGRIHHVYHQLLYTWLNSPGSLPSLSPPANWYGAGGGTLPGNIPDRPHHDRHGPQWCDKGQSWCPYKVGVKHRWPYISFLGRFQVIFN